MKMRLMEAAMFLAVLSLLGQECRAQGSGCAVTADVVFVIDSSNSICNFMTTICTEYTRIRDFVHTFVTDFQIPIDQGDMRVGCLVYSSATKVYDHWRLDRYNSSSALQVAANNIPYDAGTTYTASALKRLSASSFTAAYGARGTGYTKIAILITDGAANDKADLPAAISALDAANIERYVIGVTTSTNTQQMNDIATNPDSTHVLTAATFNDLANVLTSTFATELCTAHGPTTVATTTPTVPTTTPTGPTTVPTTTPTGPTTVPTTNPTGPTTITSSQGSTLVPTTGTGSSVAPSLPAVTLVAGNDASRTCACFTLLVTAAGLLLHT